MVSVPFRGFMLDNNGFYLSSGMIESGVFVPFRGFMLDNDGWFTDIISLCTVSVPFRGFMLDNTKNKSIKKCQFFRFRPLPGFYVR